MATTTMDITSNTIRYGAQIFQLRNITQIRVEAWKKAPALGNLSILIWLGLTWACWFYPTLPEGIYSFFSGTRPARAISLLLGLVALGIAAYGIWNRTQLNFYTLYIETSSASSSLFSSRDKDGIQNVADKIYAVMEERHAQLAYHVTIDQSRVSIGDVITNTNGTIINKSNVTL